MVVSVDAKFHGRKIYVLSTGNNSAFIFLAMVLFTLVVKVNITEFFLQ